MDGAQNRSMAWSYMLAALAGFVLGLAAAQWNSGYEPGHSRVAWPETPHPRRIGP